MSLIGMHRKRTLSIHQGSHALLASSTKLLDIRYEFYGSDGLIETNNLGILVR